MVWEGFCAEVACEREEPVSLGKWGAAFGQKPWVEWARLPSRNGGRVWYAPWMKAPELVQDASQRPQGGRAEGVSVSAVGKPRRGLRSDGSGVHLGCPSVQGAGAGARRIINIQRASSPSFHEHCLAACFKRGLRRPGGWVWGERFCALSPRLRGSPGVEGLQTSNASTVGRRGPWGPEGIQVRGTVPTLSNQRGP